MSSPLPNINGFFAYGCGLPDNALPYGCFHINTEEPRMHGEISGNQLGDVLMDASRSSSIYKGSTTVQTPSAQVLMIIKV